MLTIRDLLELCSEDTTQKIEIFDLNIGDTIYKGTVFDLLSDVPYYILEIEVQSWDIFESILCINITTEDID